MASIREQIMQLFKAKMQTITTANGYNTDFSAVYRVKTTPLNQCSTPVMFINEERQTVENSGVRVNMGLSSCSLPVTIECWIKDDSTEKGTQVNSLVEDVVKAVYTNPQWENVEGTKLAVDTIWRGDQPLLQLSSTKGFNYIGVVIVFEILYRHKVGDLTALA